MPKAPVFILTGACGSGKTTLIPYLYRLGSPYIVLDMDALYPTLTDWLVIKQAWLDVARQLVLNKKVPILCGMFLPWEFAMSPVKEQFSPYFIGLHCSDPVRRERLAARGWSEEMIGQQQACNDWLLTHADIAFVPPMPLVDTTRTTPGRAARQVAAHIRCFLQERTGTLSAGSLQTHS